jgi:DNA-binding LacI/PurR family transcriptional regulator
MSDVAELAGVSHQTVSRVINGSPHVRPETRERVQAAMRTLDYRPNRLARALVTGRSNTLGVVSFDTTLYGPASTLLGIERAAHEAGYFIIVASLKALNRSSVVDAVDRLRRHGVDGVLVISAVQDAADALRHPPDGIPLVAVEAGPHEVVPVVEVDQFDGAALATRHLLDLGHPTVWHIAGPPEFLESRQRLAGWRSTLEDAGADVPPHLTGDWSSRTGYELGRRMARERRASALFVANDQMALGVLTALQEAGRAVPGEVSVVGFDDIPESAYLMPPLTTIRQDFDELGARALQLLLQMIESGQSGELPARVPPRLVVRSSSAPPVDSALM